VQAISAGAATVNRAVGGGDGRGQFTHGPRRTCDFGSGFAAPRQCFEKRRGVIGVSLALHQKFNTGGHFFFGENMAFGGFVQKFVEISHGP
jgi:hypothetical protein